MVRVLFITRGEEHYPPMGIMQISATAKQAGHETYLALLSKDNVWERIEEVQPNVIAYSGSTGEHKDYFEFNKKLKAKKSNIITIMGGPHATFFPENTLEDAKLDAVCIGEGDYAFPNFLNVVSAGGDFLNLRNIMTRPNKRPELSSLIKNLDSLPFVDRELFYGYGKAGKNSLKHFFATRGCPFNCTYCFNESFRNMYPGQRYVRRRSVDSLLEEIQEVKEKWPMQYIKFYDDIFALKVDDWLKEFAEKYPRKIGLPFFALARVNLVNKEMVDLFYKAGCRAISLSIESANPRIREEVLKRRMTNDEIKNAYKLFGDKGIAIQSNNILGLPTSTIEDDIQTVDFNIECGPKQGAIVMAEFGTAHPYPGTVLGEYCENNGLYDTHKGFFDMHLSYQTESPLNCFSPLEKIMQRNLTMLGPIAVRFPWTRNLIINNLIKKPTNPLYFILFNINKSTGYMKHIYKIKRSFGESFGVIYKSFKKNWFKRMGEKV